MTQLPTLKNLGNQKKKKNLGNLFILMQNLISCLPVSETVNLSNSFIPLSLSHTLSCFHGRNQWKKRNSRFHERQR